MHNCSFRIRVARRLWIVAILLLVEPVFSGRLLADEPQTPSERLAIIQKELTDGEAAVMAAYYSKPKPIDEAAADKLAEEFQAKQIAGYAEALRMAQDAPTSEVARDALSWLLSQTQFQRREEFVPCLKLMTEHHADDPKIGAGLAMIAYYFPTPRDPGHAEALALLQAVLDKNPDRTVRAQAEMGLAWFAKRNYDIAHYRGEADAEKLRVDAEQRWEKILKEYGDCENLRLRGPRFAPTKVERDAQAELFELRSLQEGQPAPEITGEDLGGAKLTLSEFRGKTTLLVFWASWCGPCMGDVPHERELVARFKDRPFVLIGVNADEDLASAEGAVKEHEIPWRSVWNGKDGPAGPISRAWNVRSWPTVYVIDHKGIIRHKHLRGDRLDEPLEKLVAEAEKDVVDQKR